MADAWCAAFVRPKTPARPADHADGTLSDCRTATAPRRGRRGRRPARRPAPLLPLAPRVPRDLRRPRRRSPQTPPPAGAAASTCVLGNPPWERVKLQEQEFFASRDAEIADAPNAAERKAAIDALADANPALLEEFRGRAASGGGREPVPAQRPAATRCAGVGDVNTYSVFAEHFRAVIAARRSDGHHHPDRPRHRRHHRGVLRRHSVRRAACGVLRLRERGQDLPRCPPPVPVRGDLDDRRRDGRSGPVRLLLPATSTTSRPAASTWPPTRSCFSTRTPAPCPSSAAGRDAEITLGCYRRHPVLIRDGDPTATPGASRSHDCSTWPTTPACSARRRTCAGEGAVFDGWAWASGHRHAGCRCTRRRCSATTTTASPPTRAPPKPN